MNKSPNPKLFLLLAAAAFVLGGGVCFMAFNGLGAARDHLQQLQANSKDAKTLQQELAVSQATLRDSMTQIQHLEAGVQDYAYVPTMLTELEKLGTASGIDVTGVRPLPSKSDTKKDANQKGAVTKKSYDEMDIEVKGHGSYRSVMNFVQSLSKFPKIVAARTVELTPKTQPGQKDVSTLDVTINLRAYIFAASDGKPDAKTAMATGATHEG